MMAVLADLSPWITHGTVLAVGIALGVVGDIVLVYREPKGLRGD